MGGRTCTDTFRAATPRGSFRLSLPIPQGEWALDYRSLFGAYYNPILSMEARGALILLTLLAGPAPGVVELPTGVSAVDGLCTFCGVSRTAAKAVLGQLTNNRDPLVLLNGSESTGISIRPLWQPTARWSQAWRSFRRALYGEGWKCPRPIRRRVLARDGNRCRYCGAEVSGRALTLDHIQPRAMAGGDTAGNLVVACRPCNLRKGKRTPEEAGMPLLPIGGA